VKKYNSLLSVLLVPAMVLQAGSSCTGGGGGSTPPTLTLPATVTGIQTFNYTTATLYDFAVSSVSSAGAFSAGTTYGVWCTNPAGLVPGGGTNPNGTVSGPEDPHNSTGSATYTPVNSYTIGGAGGSDYGVPGVTYDAVNMVYTSNSLTLAQEWSAVNWILNNPVGVSGETPTTSDTQAAIWQLLHPDVYLGTTLGFVTATTAPGAALTASSWLLYKDALANGLTFIPSTGQVVAVLMVPTTPAGSSPYQGFLVPVPITCTTGTGGAATLTKTSSVTSAGAFQLITYTYTIKNTGTVPLQNLFIGDDNGTPNYPEDDFMIDLPAGTVLAPGASYTLTQSAYLPISLFYQNGGESAFDTLIPQVVPVPAGSPQGTIASLMLTYLIDTDVTDNSYGTGATAEWAANGGHTFAQAGAGEAEFGFFNSKGTLVSDFTVDYLSGVTATTKYPSGYAVEVDKPTVGGTTYISYASSTLSEDLNDTWGMYKNPTVNSPTAGSPNWIETAGYKVLVNQGIFGMYGMGSVCVKKNYLANTMDSFSGKCGSSRSVTYTPSVVGSTVNSRAYLCAQVCGCAKIVYATACLSVKLNGNSPSCSNVSAHRCQDPAHCSCGCSQCKQGYHHECSASTKCKPPACSCHCYNCTRGDHAGCTHVGCNDSTCHANNCSHFSITRVVNNKPTTFCR